MLDVLLQENNVSKEKKVLLDTEICDDSKIIVLARLGSYLSVMGSVHLNFNFNAKVICHTSSTQGQREVFIIKDTLYNTTEFVRASRKEFLLPRLDDTAKLWYNLFNKRLDQFHSSPNYKLLEMAD